MLIYSSCAFKWNRSRRISLFKRHQSDYQEVYRVERKSSHLSFRKTRELYFKANQAYKAGKLKKAEMYRMKAKDVFYEMRELEYRFFFLCGKINSAGIEVGYLCGEINTAGIGAGYLGGEINAAVIEAAYLCEEIISAGIDVVCLCGEINSAGFEVLMLQPLDLLCSASERIFDRNNKKHTMDHIDLHGLYQKEAVHFLERRVEEIIGWLESRRKEKMELNIVTGWGKGSNGVSVLQVGVEKFLKDRDFSFKEVHRGKYHVVIKRRKS
eukprot:TRINITY_DN2574_c0_g1_i2.p1 TRINITY_DN2574_c0_g1~~TRINITY_DN2574_c0_g1_i2.p1  ORF type:complete len:268 (-),score=28.15 TRINITY_DN2574_c0_g1_i2:59-862(-)